MKVKIKDIIDAVDLEMDIASSYLNIKTGEVSTYTEEELSAAESNEDVSDYPEWYREAVTRARAFVDHEDDYLELPTKLDFNEYEVMERFISRLSVEEQQDKLYEAIQGKGAFRRFKDTVERFSLSESWYDYRASELREMVEEWCGENDIEWD